jgi:hypothetical protein
VAGWWFSPGTSVSSTNKTDRHDITEILLKVALDTIPKQPIYKSRIAYAYDEMSNLYRGSWQGDLKILHKA